MTQKVTHAIVNRYKRHSSDIIDVENCLCFFCIIAGKMTTGG